MYQSYHKSTIADFPVLTSPTGDGTAISLSFEPCGGRAVCWGINGRSTFTRVFSYFKTLNISSALGNRTYAFFDPVLQPNAT